MKRNIKVVQINGFRGLLLAIFIVSCLIAGFIAFPALLTMHSWNYLSVKTSSFPAINLIEGLLLWGIIAFSAILINKRKFIVSFNSQQELSEEELKKVVNKIKAQGISPVSPMISKDITTNQEEKTEVTSEQNKG